jgi:hypothetical protein
MPFLAEEGDSALYVQCDRGAECPDHVEGYEHAHFTPEPGRTTGSGPTGADVTPPLRNTRRTPPDVR